MLEDHNSPCNRRKDRKYTDMRTHTETLYVSYTFKRNYLLVKKNKHTSDYTLCQWHCWHLCHRSSSLQIQMSYIAARLRKCSHRLIPGSSNLEPTNCMGVITKFHGPQKSLNTFFRDFLIAGFFFFIFPSLPLHSETRLLYC